MHSSVRRYFVPNSKPKWSGWVAWRAVFDAKLVEDVDGVLDEASHWWGHQTTFFASRLGRRLFTIVGGHYSNPDAPDALYKDAVWNSDCDKQVMREKYKDWHPAIRQMIEVTPYVREYPNTSIPTLDTWIYGNGRVVLIGDAAHAHGGAYAAGGSMSLDDAYAFAAALWHVIPPGSTSKYTSTDIRRALTIFERTRKPHADRLQAAAQEGNAAVLARIGKPETDEELRARMNNRPDPYWIGEHDVEAAFAKVIGKDGESHSSLSKL